MCKLYIETSDLDNAVEAYTASVYDAAREGSTIQALGSEKLKEFANAASAGSAFFPIEAHTLHAITAGIAIGLKLAESQLTLDVSSQDDVLLSLLGA